MNKRKGFFLSFEGPEAVGKSTQLLELQKFLKKNKIPNIFTREPGGTALGEKLRNIILSKRQNLTTTEEILLLMAARLNHINLVIKPAIQKGKVVITDRFADSTFVYQGFVNNLGLKKAIKLHKDLLYNFLPDKTFLFLTSPQEILKRMKSRKKLNKYDVEDLKFHKKIIEGYKILSKNNKRFIMINAKKSFNKVQNEIQITVLNLIK